MDNVAATTPGTVVVVIRVTSLAAQPAHPHLSSRRTTAGPNVASPQVMHRTLRSVSRLGGTGTDGIGGLTTGHHPFSTIVRPAALAH